VQGECSQEKTTTLRISDKLQQIERRNVKRNRRFVDRHVEILPPYNV